MTWTTTTKTMPGVVNLTNTDRFDSDTARPNTPDQGRPVSKDRARSL